MMPRHRVFVPTIALILMLLRAATWAQSNAFESDIRAFEQADLRNPPPTNSILFVGSSSIVGWESLARAFPAFNTLNRGFGGSQASDVLHFYDRIVLPYRPPLIVFYEGDNDLASGLSVETVFAAWTNFVARVHRDLPDSHILFIAVKPSPSRQQFLPQQRALNQRVREFNAGDPKLHFADVFSALLDASGNPRRDLVLSDQLHLNGAGYAIWESVIVPIVEQWAATYPIEVRKSEVNGLLIDFGSADSISGAGATAPVHWNNVTATFAASNTAVLSNLVTIQGTTSAVTLKMVSRFNGANENGTTGAPIYPASATRDSLFGNTETFSGLANVTPIFQLSGLSPGAYRLSFYASRLGVNDNRQTRYTISGATTNNVDLNAANNIESVALASGIEPSTSGTITISLAPGPQNNNANHFTYLGVLRVELVDNPGAAWLFDFGSGTSQTGIESNPESLFWNNVTETVGTVPLARLENLVTTNGITSPISLTILSPFNGANQDGATASTNFPPTATEDSLFGNRELFNGLSNVTPRFRISGLPLNAKVQLRFYASRTGVTDNRETTYSIAGRGVGAITLNAANNIDDVATIIGVEPDADGAITIELSPGPNNNNANHFTYLGLLSLNWSIAPPSPLAILQPNVEGDAFQFTLRGASGSTYDIETSNNLVDWRKLSSVALSGASREFQFEKASAPTFYRAVQAQANP